MIAEQVQYCPLCGNLVQQLERFGKIRPVCTNCDWIYFHDPKVAVAVLVVQDGRILLVQRANEPERGKWTLPGGFMDAGEDPACAAMRECLEETGVEIKITRLVDLVSHPAHTVGAHLVIYYQAEITSGELAAGDDASQVGFFPLNSLPVLAFISNPDLLSMAL